MCVHPGGLFVRAPHDDERNYTWSELTAIGPDTISARWYVSILDFKAMGLLNKISSVVRPYRTRLEIRRAVEEGLRRYAADPSDPDAPEHADSTRAS